MLSSSSSSLELSPELGIKQQQQQQQMYGSLIRHSNRAIGSRVSTQQQQRLSSPLIRHSDSGGGIIGEEFERVTTYNNSSSEPNTTSRLLAARRMGSDISEATTVRMDSGGISSGLRRVSEDQSNGRCDDDDNDDRDSELSMDVSPLRERKKAG
jgi:hypothetical protein